MSVIKDTEVIIKTKVNALPPRNKAMIIRTGVSTDLNIDKNFKKMNFSCEVTYDVNKLAGKEIAVLIVNTSISFFDKPTSISENSRRLKNASELKAITPPIIKDRKPIIENTIKYKPFNFAIPRSSLSVLYFE